MYTARRVVPTIALSANGIAACLAGGSDDKPLPTLPVARLQTSRNGIDDPAPRGGYGVNVVRYGVPRPTTTPK